MARSERYADRVDRLMASARVLERRPPRDAAWPIAYPEPADVAALYDACDGLTLDDGVRIFGRGELQDVTQWLVLEKGLGWADDLVVFGERRDVVVVIDLDVKSVRAGGGVLEVASDDLGAFDRVASGALSYLLVRSGAGEDEAPPPEVAARRAARDKNKDALERELARPIYPGHERLLASLAVELGVLQAVAGENDSALASFSRSVEARVRSVTRDAERSERAAGWRAAATAARARGADVVAAECDARSRG